MKTIIFQKYINKLLERLPMNKLKNILGKKEKAICLTGRFDLGTRGLLLQLIQCFGCRSSSY